MRFLYMKETTTYDTLLAAIKEVEIEWLESKGQIRVKAATVVDRKDEIEELRKKLDQLTTTVKSSNFKGVRPKKEPKGSPSPSKPNSPRKKEDPRRNLKGPAKTSAGPFKPGQSNFQCHKCGGWDMDGENVLLSQGILSFCSAGGQGSELNNNLFPPCKVLLINFCKH